MNPQLLHYRAIAEFKKQFYKDLLTQEHLEEGQVRINKVAFVDGSEDDAYNFWGYQFKKEGISYLLACFDEEDKEINIHEVLPIKPLQVQKIAYQGDVYHVILDYASVKPKAEQTMSFRELVDSFTSLKHSNPTHQKLFFMMGLTQMFNRANYRVCTPAGFGKDSVVATLGHLIGNCSTIVNPTRAKLGFRASLYKWLAINEVTRVPPADWELIEPFLLDAGAFLPVIENRARSWGGLNESIDISDLSLSLLYNDVDHIKDFDDFIDKKAHKALLDRFPAFRLYGTYQEDFNVIESNNIPKFVADNFSEYKRLIYAFIFYKKNIFRNKRQYSADKLRTIKSERWKINIGMLLDVVSAYSQTQEDFDQWITIINESLEDYECMLRYPEAIELAKKKMTQKDYSVVMERLKNCATYKLKLEAMKVPTEKTISYGDDKGLW